MVMDGGGRRRDVGGWRSGEFLPRRVVDVVLGFTMGPDTRMFYDPASPRALPFEGTRHRHVSFHSSVRIRVYEQAPYQISA